MEKIQTQRNMTMAIKIWPRPLTPSTDALPCSPSSFRPAWSRTQPPSCLLLGGLFLYDERPGERPITVFVAAGLPKEEALAVLALAIMPQAVWHEKAAVVEDRPTTMASSKDVQQTTIATEEETAFIILWLWRTGVKRKNRGEMGLFKVNAPFVKKHLYTFAFLPGVPVDCSSGTAGKNVQTTRRRSKKTTTAKHTRKHTTTISYPPFLLCLYPTGNYAR